MTTLKATPTVGSAPPLTLVTTRRCGGDASGLTAKGALVPAASDSVPLVWVAVTLTTASAFEYVIPVTVQELVPAAIVQLGAPPPACRPPQRASGRRSWRWGPSW